MFRRFKINKNQRGLVFERGVLTEVLRDGIHWMFDPFFSKTVDVMTMDTPWLDHVNVDEIAKSGLLGDDALVLDLGDRDRALVWIDKRFARVIGPGLHVLWTVRHDVKVEVVDATQTLIVHDKIDTIVNGDTNGLIDVVDVPTGTVALFYEDGRFSKKLAPGRYAMWNGLKKTTLHYSDLREQVLDIATQEIMTSDKVTLRVNALVTFVVEDAQKVVEAVGDHRQTIYRDAQLALREAIGTKTLDELLASKDDIARSLEATIRDKAMAFGVRVRGFGIRDLILPGEIKTLMNRVTEAKKASEASLITRREETAAMRSQANTAKILEANPTLMRLKELEVLQKVADKSNLTVVLGENGLSDRITKLL